MSKIALVTGGTSGIGKETALYLAKNGCTVYELSRRAEGVAGLRHISADVTDEASVRRAVEQILQEAGQIDILVNNAGFGISGAVEFTDTEEAERQFNVNFFGMEHESGSHRRHAQPGRRSYREFKLCGGAGAYSVPDLLFRLQGRHQFLYHGPCQ